MGNNPLVDAAEYWRKDNSSFEASRPTIGERALRSVNPMTGFGFGPAMGAMQEAAYDGDKTGMALALLQAMPLFGAAKFLPVKSLSGDLVRHMNLWGKTAKNAAVGVGTGVGIDEAQASANKK